MSSTTTAGMWCDSFVALSTVARRSLRTQRLWQASDVDSRACQPDDALSRHVRPATPVERADLRAMHAANRRAWDEAAERYEALVRRGVELIRSGGTNLLRRRGGADRRSPRPLPAGDPPAMRRRPRHAVALEPGRRRGRRRRLQSADARSGGAPVDRGGAPRRAGSQSDVLDTPHELDGTADLLYTGRGSLIWLQDLDAWAAVLRRLLAPGGRFVLFEGHPARMAVRRRRRWPLGRDRLRLLRRPGGLEGMGARIHRPAVDSTMTTSPGSSPAPGRSARSSRRILGAGLRVERVAEHPIDWWGGHADVRPEERGRIPLSFSVLARRAV